MIWKRDEVLKKYKKNINLYSTIGGILTLPIAIALIPVVLAIIAIAIVLITIVIFLVTPVLTMLIIPLLVYEEISERCLKHYEEKEKYSVESIDQTYR